MSISERPGVYTSYEVSSRVSAYGSGGAVGLAACASGGEAGVVTAVTDYAQALAKFGGGAMAELVRVLLINGAPVVYACPVADGNYESAFAALMGQREIKYMVCDSHDGAVHQEMLSAINGADEAGKYRIGIVETELDEPSELVEAARALNSERMVLVSHHQVDGTAGAVAAAVCGVLAQQSDPALPPNGAELGGLGEIGGSFSDGELTLLLKGGVTAVESVGGVISVIRGVTTRTTTAGVADTTWREVTTIMIVDRVIPQIRDSLRTKFARAKNNAQTRGAIRTQVIIQLEDMVEREFIDSYGDVSVQPDSQDPTVCLVSFSFAVAHALNRIELRASITV